VVLNVYQWPSIATGSWLRRWRYPNKYGLDGWALHERCCCGTLPYCCQRIFPSRLYVTITLIPQQNPLPPYDYSTCCADGLTVPIDLCQIKEATPGVDFGGPNIWATEEEGYPWPCDNGKIKLEWICGVADAGGCDSSGDQLKFAVTCDSYPTPVSNGAGFTCWDGNAYGLDSDDRIDCDCGSAEDECEMFFEYETAAIDNGCCLNTAPVGPKLRWKVTEVHPDDCP
jgi:hypothetical protein